MVHCSAKEDRMKLGRFVIPLMIACVLFLLAGQSGFAATKIVKFNVPGCE